MLEVVHILLTLCHCLNSCLFWSPHFSLAPTLRMQQLPSAPKNFRRPLISPWESLESSLINHAQADYWISHFPFEKVFGTKGSLPIAGIKVQLQRYELYFCKKNWLQAGRLIRCELVTFGLLTNNQKDKNVYIYIIMHSWKLQLNFVVRFIL